MVVPPELLSRPKIPRTPAEGEEREGRRNDQDRPQADQPPGSIEAVKIKGALVTEEKQLVEHGEGFVSREKIARTPPEEKKRRQQQ